MKKLISALFLFLIGIVILISCKKEIEVDPLNKYSKDKILNESQIEEVLEYHNIDTKSLVKNNTASQDTTQACQWDFNGDGRINNGDFSNFLVDYNSIYFTEDLISFLAVYGQQYNAIPIPAVNTYVQNITNRWSMETRLYCIKEDVSFLPEYGNELDSVKFYYRGSGSDTSQFRLVGENVEGLDLQLNLLDTIEPGFLPDCNGGPHNMKLIIYKDSISVERNFQAVANLTGSYDQTCFSFQSTDMFSNNITLTEVETNKFIVE